MKENYDLIVIGAGPGGYVAAIKAAQLGKTVAVVEAREVGGTCLNRGCVPTKTLMHAAELFTQLKECEPLGIKVGQISYDILAMHQRKDAVLATLRFGIEGLFKSNKIDLIEGEGTIIAPNTVLVNGQDYHGQNILIATGSVPSRPPIKGIELENVVTSDELLGTSDLLYHKLVIVGGGVIGVEFATLYHALGCEVTIIEALDRILPSMDREISQNLSMILKKRGVKIHTSARVEKIEQGEELTCHFTVKEKAEAVCAQGVLIAIGRTPNTHRLFGEGIDLRLDKGKIPVDERFESCISGIYAIGDVIKGSVQLAHVASAQGVNAVSMMFGGEAEMKLDVVPSCIYTNPEIATVGITADEAKTLGIPVKTGKFVMSSNAKTMISMGDRGFIKVVFHSETEVILGAQMMCCRATDMISELATAIANSLTIKQLSGVIRPHPTFNEGVSEAIEDACGQAIHIQPKRGINH